MSDYEDAGKISRLENTSRLRSQFWLLQIILLLCAWLAGFSTAFYKWKLNVDGEQCLKAIKGADEKQLAFLRSVDTVLIKYSALNKELDPIRYVRSCETIESYVKSRISLLENTSEKAKGSFTALNKVLEEDNIYKISNQKTAAALSEMGELSDLLINIYKYFGCTGINSGGAGSSCSNCDQLKDKLREMQESARSIVGAHDIINAQMTRERKFRNCDFGRDWVNIKTQAELITRASY